MSPRGHDNSGRDLWPRTVGQKYAAPAERQVDAEGREWPRRQERLAALLEVQRVAQRAIAGTATEEERLFLIEVRKAAGSAHER